MRGGDGLGGCQWKGALRMRLAGAPVVPAAAVLLEAEYGGFFPFRSVFIHTGTFERSTRRRSPLANLRNIPISNDEKNAACL